jgi:hypothetical protein
MLDVMSQVWSACLADTASMFTGAGAVFEPEDVRSP